MCAPRRRSLARLGGARARVEREHEPPPAEREWHRERRMQSAALRALGAPKARRVGERRLVEPLTSWRRDGGWFQLGMSGGGTRSQRVKGPGTSLRATRRGVVPFRKNGKP